MNFNFLLDDVIKNRRALHKIPETALNEFKTQKYLKDYLVSIGLEPQEICETGLYVYIEGKDRENCIAFRSDIDALNILEENEVEFVSEHKGQMHACGHDGHMATLLGFAKYLTTIMPLEKSVLLIFQPAEESPGRAKEICKSGLLQKFSVKEIYGLHLFPEIPQGTIGCRAGAFFAQPTCFYGKILGKSGHGAMPHKGVDALQAFTKVVDAYQTIISRNFSPFETTALTIGKFQGGTTFNILPETVEYWGTLRTFSQENTDFAIKRMREIHRGIEIAYNVKIEEDIEVMYPPVMNDFNLYERFLKTIDGMNYTEYEPLAIAEDFAYYQQEVPGLFILLGTRNEEKGFTQPLHNCKFNFDERALLTGIEMFAKIYHNFK